jgi:hypothetical protein
MGNGLDPDKYVVMKDGNRLEGDTYFVVRRDDLLGVATLDSYRQNIMQVLDLDELSFTITGVHVLDPEQKDHLTQLAEDVWGKIMRWEAKRTIKIPD